MQLNIPVLASMPFPDKKACSEASLTLQDLPSTCLSCVLLSSVNLFRAA